MSAFSLPCVAAALFSLTGAWRVDRWLNNTVAEVRVPHRLCGLQSHQQEPIATCAQVCTRCLVEKPGLKSDPDHDRTPNLDPNADIHH